MFDVGEVHFRVLYLLGAVGVLFLLRQPLRYPKRPASRWFALTIVAVSAWLFGVGLYYFDHTHAGSFALYCLVLFSITVCFAGWILVAIEFSTGRSAPRSVLLVLGVFAITHLFLLVTNYAGFHELIYLSSSFVDDGGGLNVRRGPLFWVHIVVIYVLVFLSAVLFGAEWANSSGLRRRQAGIMVLTPIAGLGASALWFAEVLPFPFDPTPVGATLGVVMLGWVLYRSKFVEIVPIARDTVVEEMSDAVVIIDAEDRVIDWNAEAGHRFDAEDASEGIPADEFFDSVPDETLAKFTDTTQTETQISFEHDGTAQHFAVSISPIESADDSTLLGRVVVIRDVTDEKRREEQLLKQNEYLDQFAGIVSHDLQGPLMEIRGSADATIRSGDPSYAESVLEATDRIERLVDDLLRLARTGRQVDDVSSVELSEAAETAWRRVWSSTATLTIEADTTIAADNERLLQLLENLFRNGIEHAIPDSMQHPSSLTSANHARNSAATVALESATIQMTVGSLPDGFFVEDSGSGIPPEDRDRVFERGYTTTSDGTGLGLSIIRQIAKAHGWAVLVTEGTDGGARFEFRGVTVLENSNSSDR
ncbi:histidine kinase N-terminal 7TM domain-containing protein [Halobellus captivus]|uniref:histidine kinase N-terminal 7TM domain-containing protein n=1 Tax=Halobellus captivus TaxID=2592614 RepID=UPI00119E64A8|nr:histidine kinase N-terminal 7TM domain-containing protein [Halobellus captivus]